MTEIRDIELGLYPKPGNRQGEGGGGGKGGA
jgi:hypothetical protein